MIGWHIDLEAVGDEISIAHVLFPNIRSVWGKRLLSPELEDISDPDAGCRDACSMLSQPLLVAALYG
jgi:hypothetical protein